MEKPTCLKCGKTHQQMPLIPLTFKGAAVFICPQCLPTLIHKPQELAEKLSGMEIDPPSTVDAKRQ